MTSEPSPKRHILTVALEDYFQVGAFNSVIQRGQWYRFETRLEKNADRTLDLLDRNGIKATFFVLGWIADRFPELVRKVADRGHEIASKGYFHRGIRQMTPDEFKDDCLRSREALERASGQRVVGYRVAHEWFHEQDLWALDALAELGFEYDSSIAPIGRTFAKEPFRRYLHQHRSGEKTITELPISTGRILGIQMPIAGGNYVRQLPAMLIRRAVSNWHQNVEAPLVVYFHVWELDPEQPKIMAGGWLSRLRHYRNLHKMEGYLEYFFQRYSFTGAADYLGLSLESGKALEPLPNSKPTSRMWQTEGAVDSDTPSGPRTPVSIVIPCYNEELILPYLSNTLESVAKDLSSRFAPTFHLVDDGSKDNTWEGMQKTFGGKPGFEIHRHAVNQGVAAAIMTGLRHTRTEIACSMDCDCTYDPHELANMIPKLEPGVDLVTASPYHPEGQVRNVPGWRLKLSKSASWLYRRVLRQKLYTYTSCFRVYRRSSVVDLPIRENGYLGIAEMLGRLDLQGSRIVEYPATLEVRMLGRSKMKTLRTIFGHLRLMTRLFGIRIRRWWTKEPEAPSTRTEPPPVDKEHAISTEPEALARENAFPC
ncbi:MAG: DUF3473 domain-containing protein [Planctomycetes bacterium]|nr:DUF3473 domain-containing protein [Planctomycetota bacterium]